MRKIIFLYFLTTSLICGQNTYNSEDPMTSVYKKLIDKNGSIINFEYLFENDSHQMKNPVKGKLGLFSDNRFYLEFNPSNNNKVIQIYNGEALFTILPEETEIQIDNIDQSQGMFIQDVFHNYQNDFNSYVKEKTSKETIIELTPKTRYHEAIFNQCIDQLDLPKCLQLPNQCKIGLSILNKEKLKTCLEEKGGYKENNIVNIEITIDTNELVLKSIIQLDRYNGKSSIQINSIQQGDLNMLDINNTMYSDFEIIDLR